jgi:tripartite-type tricarboxylate transporter receptor subunit TctC
MHRSASLVGASCIFFLGAVPGAAAFPDRTIALIVPYTPAGSTDAIARIVGEHMAKTLGQTIIIENDAGAGGTTATGPRGADGGQRLIPDAGTHGHARCCTGALSQSQI